jgi:hypothetical protein
VLAVLVFGRVEDFAAGRLASGKAAGRGAVSEPVAARTTG